MNEIVYLWKIYNSSVELLKAKLNRTSNIVGEYAEYLIKEYLDGELLTASFTSADIKAPNGKLYQVKSRKITNGLTTQLGIIRSWDFDFLTIILFDTNGSIIKGLIYPKSIAEKYAKENEHQNGWVISTTTEFLNDENRLDITQNLREINKDSTQKIKEPSLLPKQKVKSQKKENNSELNPKESEIEKIIRKLPGWFKKPNLICSQILIIFLELENGNGSVDYETLSHKCNHIKTFKTNFPQMVNFGEKNHGKVFEKTDSIITIWNPVKENVKDEYEKYLMKKKNEL